jgi:aspartyl protease family protein
MRRNAWTWSGLCLLLLAGLVLIATAPGAPLPDSADQELRLSVGKALGLLALIAAGLILGTHQRGAIALKQFLGWGAAGLTVAVLLTYRAPLTSLFDALELPPATTDAAPKPETSEMTGVSFGVVSLGAAANGHFIADAFVNGTRVSFIVDTGATDVVLRRRDAERLGIDLDALNYDVPVQTPNGDTFIAVVDLDEIVIGSIRVEHVRASVPLVEFSHSLLGMTFLSKLSGFSVSPEGLVMRQ